MGYKLAGFNVVAANDIDPEMAWHYKANLHPKHYFLCPIRELIGAELPEELFGIDVLDGSPPCSTFSMAGSREKAWGKEKYFREGQAKQVLSDLFFDYLDLVEYLKPKVAVAENVKGMIAGNARGYVKMVMARFVEIGYRPQLFLVNAADCGVPQKRERVFFCAVRRDVSSKALKLAPASKLISAQSACSGLPLTRNELGENKPAPEGLQLWAKTKPGDTFAKAKARATGKEGSFGRVRLCADLPSVTLTSRWTDFYHWSECRTLTMREWKRLGSFPDDYSVKTNALGRYLIGMSVPPKMTRAVAAAIHEQWLK